MNKRPKVYGTCDAGCRWEVPHKDEIDIASKIKTTDGSALNLFIGTEAEYNALSEEQKANTFAIFTDDTSREDLDRELLILKEGIRLTEEDYVLSVAEELPEGVYHLRIDYSAGIPSVGTLEDPTNPYKWSYATVYKHSEDSITVVIWGGDFTHIQYNRYYYDADNYSREWTGWIQVADSTGWKTTGMQDITAGQTNIPITLEADSSYDLVVNMKDMFDGSNYKTYSISATLNTPDNLKDGLMSSVFFTPSPNHKRQAYLTGTLEYLKLVIIDIENYTEMSNPLSVEIRYRKIR